MQKQDFTNRTIYHITHINNLSGIIEQGCLWSDNFCRNKGHTQTNIGYAHIKERRTHRHVPVSAGGKLADYVPFYFAPCSPMLYAIHKGIVEGYTEGQKNIIYLMSTLESALKTEKPFCFTDRHAELAWSSFFDTVERLDQVSWQVMEKRYWSNTEQDKEKRQAEFLVHESVPWSCIESIGVYNKKMAEQARRIIKNASHRPNVSVKSEWYF
ncbi:MAG: DUF4433 domain-containing protein [Planctomycetes bacterium]|nr:DUF4433 domain-containing protein [Planctomycetota bacterium]